MSDPSVHLVLVGLMGAGKSAVGLECAKRLSRPFVDTDALVEQAAGATVAEVFAREGEGGFRRREQDAVTRACAADRPSVIACGGGAVLSEANREALRRSGFVVWLTAPVDELSRRVGDEDGRPLLAGATPAVVLDRLAGERAGAYRAAAHVEIDTEGREVEAVADAVLAAFREAA